MNKDMSGRKPPLVVYHSPCADGAGAAFAAWCEFTEGAEYRPAQAGDPAPTDEEVSGRDVYVLDMSYPLDESNRIWRKTSVGGGFDDYLFLTIDHHKTAAETLVHATGRLGELPVLRPYAHIDQSHSGAVLAWQHFHHGIPVPEVLLYIEDRDLWKWDLPHSREVSAALDARGLWRDFRVLVRLFFGEGENWRGFCGRPHEHIAERWSWVFKELVAEGVAVLRGQEQQVEVVAQTAEEVQIPGTERDFSQRACARHLVGGNFARSNRCDECAAQEKYGSPVPLRCLAANSCLLQSEAGALLAERSRKEGGAPMAVVWYFDGKRYKVSLRSVGDFDVSAIAKSFGGGGHRNAAAFYCLALPWTHGWYLTADEILAFAEAPQ